MKLSGGRGEPTDGGSSGLASPPSCVTLRKSHRVSEPSFLIRKAGLPGFQDHWLQVALEAGALSHCSGREHRVWGLKPAPHLAVTPVGRLGPCHRTLLCVPSPPLAPSPGEGSGELRPKPEGGVTGCHTSTR